MVAHASGPVLPVGERRHPGRGAAGDRRLLPCVHLDAPAGGRDDGEPARHVHAHGVAGAPHRQAGVGRRDVDVPERVREPAAPFGRRVDAQTLALGDREPLCAERDLRVCAEEHRRAVGEPDERPRALSGRELRPDRDRNSDTTVDFLSSCALAASVTSPDDSSSRAPMALVFSGFVSWLRTSAVTLAASASAPSASRKRRPRLRRASSAPALVAPSSAGVSAGSTCSCDDIQDLLAAVALAPGSPARGPHAYVSAPPAICRSDRAGHRNGKARRKRSPKPERDGERRSSGSGLAWARAASRPDAKRRGEKICT